MLSFNALNVENRKNRVAVVAVGIVSPLGSGLEETRHSLRRATDCVTPVSSFDVSRCRCKTAAQISDQRLLARRQKNRKNARLHRASHMMIAALTELLERDPGFRPEVTVIGTTPFSYQWRFYGADIPGATQSSFTITNVQTTNAGAYSVLHIVAAATLQNDRVDSLNVEQVRQQQPRRSCADDADLGADAHLRFSFWLLRIFSCLMSAGVRRNSGDPWAMTCQVRPNRLKSLT